MTSTDWIIVAVLFALLLFILIRRFQAPQSADIDLAVGVFMLITAGCSFASGEIPTQYRDVIDRTRDPVFFWIFIVVCSGAGLIHIAKFVFRSRSPGASPRR